MKDKDGGAAALCASRRSAPRSPAAPRPYVSRGEYGLLCVVQANYFNFGLEIIINKDICVLCELLTWLGVKNSVRMDWKVTMLPPTAGLAQEQRDRPEMAYQQRRDVRELTREIIRDARVANRQQSMSPGGK